MNEHRHIEDLAGDIKPRTASNVLLWVVAAFFIAFIAWASLTKLDRTVKGGGRVIASSHLQVVSNLEGGIVEAILVRTGQVVQAGQELIRLDRTQSGAELGSGEASVNALSAKIARLQAEVTGREPVYPRPGNEEVARQIQIERALHASRTSELASLVNAGQARILQASRAVQEASAAYDARVSARTARKEELDIIRPLVAKGIEPRLSLSQAESAYMVAVAEAASAAAALSRAQASVGEAQATLSQQRQDWRSVAANELATAQGEYSARSSAIPALAERVARTSVRSPLPGRVNRVLVTTVGSAVGPGAPMIEIVPSEESLLIEAMVRPQDIAFVKTGQKARVNITAYDPSVYGSLHGVVTAISPDVTVNEKSGESFYIVQVRTNSNALKDRNGKALPIGTGMVADVSLLGDKRTIMQYILTPITRLTETAFRE
ncbi:MAG: HlyD family type I secretion periplasmic adaptor subunit [Alphaproteobacteria bacterium]|nr:HlyD family type I secretion periplasmic adaptor subunit [Alphaproteobacteria bacterium]MBV9373436.1 HlyD family type I secretion periplasmic adaptor subunit [Alphaproteobacteria bacterium]MBV9900978.1 HlyD family type I secretion periplasmic adaptor subunit [Alphaproteobacteria bacterium]